MSKVIVGLVADPGLPQKIVESLVDDLQQELRKHDDSQTTWTVETSSETLPLNADGDIPFPSLARRLEKEKEWDYFFYVTDLPRRTHGIPMLCEIDYSTRAALISLPVLGAVRIRSRVQRLVMSLLRLMNEQEAAGNDNLSRALDIGRIHYRVRQDCNEVRYLATSNGPTRLRLLLGMVRNNRPGRLVPALSNSVAAAAATGAFGIFYASIWHMADALPPMRLLLISVLAVAALSTWLIVHNGLWNRDGELSTPRDAAWDNASTTLTVFLSVTLMYLVLYAVVLCGALAVISTDYLQSQLDHPVGFSHYAKLAWLAASLGTTAGALGSNFDSDEAIREATYSRREHERRKLADSYEK